MRPLRVWLLSDGAPGHVSQSRGIVDALAAERELDVETVSLKVKSGFWKRIGRLCLPYVRHPDYWLRKVYRLELPLREAPDLVVSSGANTLLANALIARLHGAVSVYSGTLKGYDPAAFSCVFTVVPIDAVSNHVLPLPPVPGGLSRPLPHDPTEEKLLAVLVGGDGAGYEYAKADWLQLAEQLVLLATKERARLLITTSRRTGAGAESVLRENVPAGLVADAVWWSDAPRPVVRDFLARASAVVVTEDSLTMVAESIYSGRPVISVSSAVNRPNDNDRRALEAYQQRGLLQRRGVADLAGADLSSSLSVIPDVPAEIAKTVYALLEGKET